MEAWGAFLGLVLALAVALDKSVSDQAKSRFVAMLRNSASAQGPAVGLARAFDGVAGPQLVSWRAFRFSLMLSATSIVIMLAAVWAIDGNRAFALYEELLSPGGPAKPVILIICVSLVLVGDFLSFAQTRLFMKAANLFRDRYVTGIMVVADILSSMFLFAVFMSFGRLIAYFIVSNYVVDNPIRLGFSIAPSAVAGTLQRANIDSRRIREYRGIDPRARRLQVYLATSPAAMNFPSIAQAARDSDLDRNLYPRSITYEAEWACVGFDPAAPVTNDLSDAASNTVTHITQGLAALDPGLGRVERPYLLRLISAEMMESFRPGPSCNIPTIFIYQQVHTTRLMRDVGPGNLLLASFALTLGQTVGSLPDKFAGYITLDPAADLLPFLSFAVRADAATFLSIGGIDPGKIEVSSLLYHVASNRYTPADSIEVPFTTLAASSMAPSFIFAFFILLRQLFKAWSYTVEWAGARSDLIKSNDYLFTFLAVVLIAILGLVLLAGAAL